MGAALVKCANCGYRNRVPAAAEGVPRCGRPSSSGWGSPGPWPKPSPTTWTGMKSSRWYTAAAGRGSP